MKRVKINASKIKLWFFFLFIIFLAIFSLSLGIFDIDHLTLVKFLENNPNYPKTIFFILMTIAVVIAFPVSIVALGGLLVFEMVDVLILTTLSLICGMLLMYYLAKMLGEKGFEEYAGIKGTKMYSLHKLLKKNKYAIMTLLSFVYFFPSNLAGVGAAFTKTKLSEFFWIGFLGNAINIWFFITLVEGVLVRNIPLMTISFIFLLINSLVPIFLYRRHILGVFSLVFKK